MSSGQLDTGQIDTRTFCTSSLTRDSDSWMYCLTCSQIFLFLLVFLSAGGIS